MEQIEADKKLKSVELKKRDTAYKNLKLMQEYLETHSRDEWLVSGLAGIEEQFGNILAVEKEISTITKAEVTATNLLNTSATTLKDRTNQLNTRKQEVNNAREYLEQGRKI